MKAKRLYAKAMKKLRGIEDIAEEVDVIHHYVCELRKPHVRVETVEVRDNARIEQLERELHDLQVKHKELEQKLKFEQSQLRQERGQLKYPPAPVLHDKQAVIHYVDTMTEAGLRRIRAGGVEADHWNIVSGLLVVTVNAAMRKLDAASGFKFRSLPKQTITGACERIHLAVEGFLNEQLELTRQALFGGSKPKKKE